MAVAAEHGHARAGCRQHQLATRDILQFERQGFIVLRDVLPENQVKELNKEVEQLVQAKRLAALQQRVRVLCPGVSQMPASEKEALRLLKRQATDSVGFLQFFNNWLTSELVRTLVCSEALAGTAAQLLGVSKLRLFQDCVFYKEPGFTETNWHSDLRMTPLDTNHFLTAWVPLRPIQGHQPAQHEPATHAANSNPSAHQADPSRHQGGVSSPSGSSPGPSAGATQALPSQRRARASRPPRHPGDMKDSGLLFAVGSHRDFALPFWYDLAQTDLTGRYELTSNGSMDLGDVSFHHGWTLHAAGPQAPGTPARTALAVSYFADGAKLRKRRSRRVRADMEHDEDADSYGAWLSQLPDGAVARHARLPVVYPSSEDLQGMAQAAASPPADAKQPSRDSQHKHSNVAPGGGRGLAVGKNKHTLSRDGLPDVRRVLASSNSGGRPGSHQKRTARQGSPASQPVAPRACLHRHLL